MPSLRKQYSIKLRDQKDYDILVKSDFKTNVLSLKTTFFDNRTEAIKEGELLIVKSELDVSAVTIGLAIIGIGLIALAVKELGWESLIVGLFIAIAIFDSIVKSEHTAIECHILRRLYYR
tara:strand:- start:17683 stop:18042 length:360 start_codon:yes stop_codon:yes gene_type:complete